VVEQVLVAVVMVGLAEEARVYFLMLQSIRLRIHAQLLLELVEHQVHQEEIQYL
jgi:hypothetical protein